ncbi:thiol-disulfide oxidoreductase DCC family protein [Roseicyclus persicicus]|uniref:DUF393 domain-containing protein n=1 Tax=Roseicyclus persicicus TaxID=2650661 RepID=A0A7X6GX04_9RHOB|nr:DCC1-like thiol-disulfide oxidoreductase family protein [Roseibacterium persicicum]NKX43956.1 DUF393 domain-containing protein [Roseibacterium persicicum]
MPAPFARHVPPALAALQPVALMDADCALCTRGARMIHRLDRTGTIRICPVQTDTGRAALAHYGLDPDDPETWLFLADGMAWRDLDAMTEVGRRTGGWGRALAPLAVLPAPLRGWLYRRLARNRYALFGRADMCALPDPGFARRLVR